MGKIKLVASPGRPWGNTSWLELNPEESELKPKGPLVRTNQVSGIIPPLCLKSRMGAMVFWKSELPRPCGLKETL
jgi:hypothetical protein